MPCKEKGKITSFLFVVTIYFYKFQFCRAVSIAPWPDILNTHQHHKLRPESAAFPGKPFLDFIGPKLDELDSNFAQSSLSWTLGDISTLPRSWPSHSEDGYQRDFTSKNCFRDHNAGQLDGAWFIYMIDVWYPLGFYGVQGKVLGPSSDSSQHLSEWLAMRPVVQCDRNAMIFTASGEGLTQLLVDRGKIHGDIYDADSGVMDCYCLNIIWIIGSRIFPPSCWRKLLLYNHTNNIKTFSFSFSIHGPHPSMISSVIYAVA